MKETVTEPPTRQRWYVHAESKVYGPYDKSTIKGMIERNQLLRDDKIHIEGGSTWVDAESDPSLGPLFRKHSAPPVRKARTGLSWLRLAPAMLFLAILGWIAWPYYVVFSLFNAVHDGDVATLEKRVDWARLRDALRGDLNVSILKMMNDKGNADDALGKGFAAVLGPAVINNMVDGYVTPQGIAALARNQKQPESSGGVPAFKNIDQIRNVDWDRITYAFFEGSPFSFRVDVRSPDAKDNRPVGLELGWSGDWRLVRIRLPSDLLEAPSQADAKLGNKILNRQISPPKTQQNKIAEPPPVELALLSKRFREANYRASPAVQTAIEFELSIVNKTQQQIRAFDGELTFTDLLDNSLLSSRLAINDPVSAGSSVRWSGEIEYNQFMDSHKRLRNADMQNIKIKFVPRKLLYADGSMKEFNN